MMDTSLRTDETDDVAGSIRHAIRSAGFVADDAHAWKWVALALHSALQGACVCHLTTTAAPLGAVTKRNSVEWLAYFEDSRANPHAQRPDTYLMALPALLKATRKPHSAGDRSNLAGVTISNTELRWLGRFHRDVRNQFVHFEPMGWTLEVSGIPGIAALIARIIGEIIDVGWAFRHQDAAWHGALRNDLARLTELVPAFGA